MNRRTLFKLLAMLPFVGSAATRILAKGMAKPTIAPGPYLPPFFPKWNKATDGLEEAGRWAIEVERFQLPAMVVPRVGEVWETVRDCEVTFRPRFEGGRPQFDFRDGQRSALPAFAFLFGGPAQLQPGERVRIVSVDNDKKPLYAVFRPLRYDELHTVVVPEEVRGAVNYIGYTLSVKTAKTLADFRKDQVQSYFNQDFRLVEKAAIA